MLAQQRWRERRARTVMGEKETGIENAGATDRIIGHVDLQGEPASFQLRQVEHLAHRTHRTGRDARRSQNFFPFGSRT